MSAETRAKLIDSKRFRTTRLQVPSSASIRSQRRRAARLQRSHAAPPIASRKFSRARPLARPCHARLRARLCPEEPGLVACYEAEQPGLQLVVSQDRAENAQDSAEVDEPVPKCAASTFTRNSLSMGGIENNSNGYAVTSRARHSLSITSSFVLMGGLELTLKSVWRDGTRAVVYEPHDFVARLIAAIPPPRFHQRRGLWP
jgi:hypothetical protein